MLENQLLISVPTLDEPLSERVVVYVCEHSEKGAIGLIINKPSGYRLDFILDQLGIDISMPNLFEKPVLFGGPVQQDRGFVIHRPFQNFNANLGVSSQICISTSQEILRRMASGDAPEDSLVTLGYAGWAATQLDDEIKQNIWLTCTANEELLYEVPFAEKWQAAIDFLGFDISQLVMTTNTSKLLS